MKFIPTDIPDVIIVRPEIFGDSRGVFFETFNSVKFAEAGIRYDFLQDNQSVSSKGVLRGLHFQNPPFAQGKLVRVISGAVQDVAVDIRKDSSTYGKWVSVILTGDNHDMLWLPPGFAHGFLALEDKTVFSYKCTNVYNRDSEGVIKFSDPDLNIQWELPNPILSERDAAAPFFKNHKNGF